MPGGEHDFSGDWLAEVGHPWAQTGSAPAPKRPVDRSPERGTIRMGLWPLALLAAIVTTVALASVSAADTATPQAASKEAAAPQPQAGVDVPRAKLTDERRQRPLLGVLRERHYRQAARAYGIPWQLLAAIGKLESDHGRSGEPGVYSGHNFAGCAGPMQICITEDCGNTFARYGVDGDGDGAASPYSYADAAHSAANYLNELKRMLASSDLALLLAAYNAGPGAVIAAGGVPPYSETQSYVARGLDLIASWKRR